MNIFGQRIRELRVGQKLGLRQTASFVNISPAYLSRIESGKTGPPKPDTIRALAGVLGVEAQSLFGLTSSLDPDIHAVLEENSRVIDLLRMISINNLKESHIDQIIMFVRQFILT